MSERLTEERPITLDLSAAQQLLKFIDGKDSTPEDVMLRIQVIGGGCTGFQYRLGLDDRAKEEDMTFESHGCQVVIDKVSYSLVAGSVVTYRDDLNNAGFQIENPNVIASCGCGSSFEVDPAAVA